MLADVVFLRYLGVMLVTSFYPGFRNFQEVLGHQHRLGHAQFFVAVRSGLH
jgi:hypothetical protein